MCSLKIGQITVGQPTDEIFIIAEIGQNHQGSIEIAKEMILSAKDCGCNCVKFQKSCLPAKFTTAALNRPYNGPNSWGKTYGEHKEFLEFSIDEYRELKNYANLNGIIFSASAMDEVSLDDLISLKLQFIKIGSGDANNILLLEKAAKLSIPLVISTGMQTISTIDRIVKIMHSQSKLNFALLHCISSYPTTPQNSALDLIRKLKNRFPDILIGYSGHEEGFLLSQAAILLGAKIIERHFTLDKKQKGSDHKCSLDPIELKEFVQSVRRYEKQYSLNVDNKSYENIIDILKKENNLAETDINNLWFALRDSERNEIFFCELECQRKLGKSLCYSKKLKKGSKIEKCNLVVKVSEPFGISAELLDNYLDRQLVQNVDADQNLSDTHFC